MLGTFCLPGLFYDQGRGENMKKNDVLSSVVPVLSTGTKIIPVSALFIPVPVLELELELEQ